MGGVNWDISDTANSLEFSALNQRLTACYVLGFDQTFEFRGVKPHAGPLEEIGVMQIIQ